MKPNHSYLRGSIIALAIVAVSGAGCGACKKKPGATAGSALSEIPAASIGAVYVNVARLRAHPSVVQMRTQWNSSPQGIRFNAPIRSACGFDPIERLDSFTAAMTAAPPMGQDAIAVAHGNVTAAEATHCLTEAFQLLSRRPLVPTTAVAGHPVFLENDPRGIRTTEFAVLEHGIVAARSASMESALALVDHPPSVNSNRQLTEAASNAGSDAVILILADFVGIKGTIPAGRQPSFNIGMPGASAEVLQGLWQSAQNGAFAIRITPSGIHIGLNARFATPTDAHLASSLLTSAWSMARMFVMREPAFNNPAAAFEGINVDPATLNQATQALTVARSLTTRLTITDTADLLRVDLDISQQELDTLTVGAQAALRTFMMAPTPPPYVPPTNPAL